MKTLFTLALCSILCGVLTAGCIAVLWQLWLSESLPIALAGSFGAVALWALLAGEVVGLTCERIRED